MGEGRDMGRGADSARQQSRRGSTSSDRQIAFAVRDYLQVQFLPNTPNHPWVKGWVMGMDDYHWVVANERGEVHLVHKSCPLVTITTTTLADCDKIPSGTKDRIESLVEPFRNYVLAHHLGHNQESRSASA